MIASDKPSSAPRAGEINAINSPLIPFSRSTPAGGNQNPAPPTPNLLSKFLDGCEIVGSITASALATVANLLYLPVSVAAFSFIALPILLVALPFSEKSLDVSFDIFRIPSGILYALSRDFMGNADALLNNKLRPELFLHTKIVSTYISHYGPGDLGGLYGWP